MERILAGVRYVMESITNIWISPSQLYGFLLRVEENRRHMTESYGTGQKVSDSGDGRPILHCPNIQIRYTVYWPLLLCPVFDRVGR